MLHRVSPEYWPISTAASCALMLPAATFTPDRRDEERCVAFRGIGYDLVELGRLDDAEAAYRKCLAIIPDEPKSLGEIEYIREQRKKSV